MKKFAIIFGLTTLITISACKKQDDHDDDHDDENELITSVKLHFIDPATNDTLNFAWRQPAGPATAISVDTIKLVPGKTYIGLVEFWDESENPAENITEEIQSSPNEHRVVYTSSTQRIQTNITDVDTNIPPIELGLKFNAITTTTGADIGIFQVVLRHYTSSSPKTGGLQNGTADADVNFPIVIK